MKAMRMTKKRARICVFLVILLFVAAGCDAKDAIPPVDSTVEEAEIETIDSAAENDEGVPQTAETAREQEPVPLLYEIQARVKEDMPLYRFVATGADAGDNYVLSTGLTVYDENDSQILFADFTDADDEWQTDGYWMYREMAETLGLHVADMNFDGYRDVIVLRDFFGAHGNTWYDCWLWEDGLSAFSHCPSFAEICNPSIDRENRRIYSTGGSGASVNAWEIYRFINGEYVVSNRLRSEGFYESDPRGPGVGIVEERLTNGTMAVVRDAFVTYDAWESLYNAYENDELWRLSDPRWYPVGGPAADRWLD
jgi:hypothetical protein